MVTSMWWAELKTGWTMQLRSRAAPLIAKSLVNSGLAVSACGNTRVKRSVYSVVSPQLDHYEQDRSWEHGAVTIDKDGRTTHHVDAAQFLTQAAKAERMVADIFARGTYEFECTKCGTTIKGSTNSIYPCNTIKVSSVKCPNDACDASYTVEMSR